MWKMTWIQLMNRWRSNVWVCVELLLAFCLGVHDVAITGDTKLASDTCVVFSSDNLRITPIMKGE